MNLLHLQWLIPYHGKEWTGKVTQGNYDWLFNEYQSEIKYWAKNPMDNKIPETDITSADGFLSYANDYFKDGMTILSITSKFNPLILVPIIIIFILSMIVPLILRCFKKMDIDVFVFSIPIVCASIIFLFLGFIPNVSNNWWLLLLRFVIFFVVLIILFLISNKIINHFIGCSQLGAQAITDIANQASERHQSQQTLRELKELYKKQDDLTSVEIDKAN
ncbi:MAG: hypothetical protein LBD63_04090 [Mycoplasmataceae bacterium]|nr:hypothetical protein [Mycoplasmataceae bacterium]